MIQFSTPEVKVTRVVTQGVVWYTISENNFGSLHHVSFYQLGLCRILNKLERFLKVGEPDLTSAREVERSDTECFVRIWQLTENKRSISLTLEQIQELLTSLEGTDNLRRTNLCGRWCIA